MGYKIKKEINRIQKKREMKKKPSNAYPKLAFRIDAETKEELLAWIDSLYCHYLDRKEKEQYTIKKNDIIIEALRIGLKKIEQDIKNVPLLKKKDQSLKIGRDEILNQKEKAILLFKNHESHTDLDANQT